MFYQQLYDKLSKWTKDGFKHIMLFSEETFEDGYTKVMRHNLDKLNYKYKYKRHLLFSSRNK